MLVLLTVALLLILGATVVVMRAINRLARFCERMHRYAALMDEAEELEPNKEEEKL